MTREHEARHTWSVIVLSIIGLLSVGLNVQAQDEGSSDSDSPPPSRQRRFPTRAEVQDQTNLGRSVGRSRVAIDPGATTGDQSNTMATDVIRPRGAAPVAAA